MAIYTFEPSGGVLLSGGDNSVIIYNPSPSSGILVGGSASVDLETTVNISGGIVIGGTQAYKIDKILSIGLSGGITVEGSALVSASYNFVSFGDGINPPEFAGISLYLEEPAPTKLVVKAAIVFRWQVRGSITKRFEFTWNTGAVRQYYYKVVGICKPLDGPIVADSDNYNCNFSSSVNILAKSTEDLCAKLKRINWTWPIDYIDRYSIPVSSEAIAEDELNGIDHSILKLERIENARGLLVCADFFLNNNIVENITFDDFVTQFTEFEYGCNFTDEADILVSCGIIRIQGQADFSFDINIVQKFYVSSSETSIELEGQVEINSFTNWSYDSSGDIVIDGEAFIVASHWNFISSGSMILENEAQVLSSAWNHNATGNLTVSGDTTSLLGLNYVSDGKGFVLPQLAGITLSGSYLLSYDWEGLGGVIVTATTEVISSYWEYEGIGEIETSGTSISFPSYYEYDGNGDIVLVSNNIIKVFYGNYLSTSDIELGGSAELDSLFDYEGVGEIILDGFAGIISPVWFFENISGEIILNEEAVYQSSHYILDENFEAEDLAELIEVRFAALPVTPALGRLVGQTKKCACNVVYTINLNTNFPEKNKFSDFVLRNNLTFNQDIFLNYNAIYDSWQNNFHYRGLSTTTNNEESWDLLFDLQCTNIYAGRSLGFTTWKFGVSVIKLDLVTMKDLDFRFSVFFDNDSACDDSENLEFKLSIDTQRKLISTVPTMNLTNFVFYDNLSLFKNAYWRQNPLLTFNITESRIVLRETVTEYKLPILNQVV